MTRSYLACLCALLLACGTQGVPSGTETDEPADAGPSPTVTLVGDTAFLELPLGRSADNGELRVAFDAVTEDSRCPSDVQCVWAGNAGIRLTVSIGNDTEVAIVNSTLNPQQAAFFGYSIGFRELTPYPVAQVPTDRDSYVATISIVDTR